MLKLSKSEQKGAGGKLARQPSRRFASVVVRQSSHLLCLWQARDERGTLVHIPCASVSKSREFLLTLRPRVDITRFARQFWAKNSEFLK